MKTFSPFAAVLVLAALFAGCATPDTRIHRSPEVFARLTPAQQALVRQGKVAIGFDADAVRLAVGLPDRKWTRMDAAGTREVWSYSTWENDRGQPLYHVSYPGLREHEYFKVIFGPDGKVVAIEEDIPR